MLVGQSETFSRIFIDKALEFSGWDLLNPRHVQFELHRANGRVGYLFKNKLEHVQCGIKAKCQGRSTESDTKGRSSGENSDDPRSRFVMGRATRGQRPDSTPE